MTWYFRWLQLWCRRRSIITSFVFALVVDVNTLMFEASFHQAVGLLTTVRYIKAFHFIPLDTSSLGFAFDTLMVPSN